jgi:hypothetical protein
MSKLGLICNDSLDIVGHSLFNNFRLALKNYFQEPFVDVKSNLDLEGIEILFIVDEHFTPNVPIWKNDTFINETNNKNIVVVVFNFEKIFNSSFPWNVDHQKKLEQFKNLYQLVSDIDDARLLSKKIINKQFLSKDTVFNVDHVEKIDKILFLGQCNGYYKTRKNVLTKMASRHIPLEVHITNRQLSYQQFLTKLASYKYILNPLGTGKFLNLRFYEALKLRCLPIQEITSDMLLYYPELKSSYNFANPENIDYNDISNFNQSNFDYYLEDYFRDIDLKKNII